MRTCKCGHRKAEHKFTAWLPQACYMCNCDDFEEDPNG